MTKIKTNIPGADGKKKLIKKNGDTSDIIESMLRLDSFYDAEFCKFSQQFASDGGPGDTSGLKKLWHFVKYEISYKKDPDGKSIQGTPPATWKLGTADCKNKTLFVNAVLRCLQIPYIIRFTSYGKANVSHVYTVAIVGNKQIPIDAVWDYFGEEKKYHHKIDYPMTDIIEISGIKSSTELARAERRDKPATYVPQDIKTCNWSFPVTEAAMKLAEIKQKQAYVKEPEMIAFSKLNEAQAALQIVERELSIIAVMRPELEKIALKGIEMIRKTKGKDFCITGDVPKELNRVAARIRSLEKMQQYSATGWGILGRRIAQHKQNIKANRYGDGVGAFPERVCLNNLWFSARPTSATDFTPNFAYVNDYPGGTTPYPQGSQNKGFCSPGPGFFANYSYQKSGGPTIAATEAQKSKYFDFFYYGKNTPYRVNYAEFANEYENILLPKIITDGLGFGRGAYNSGGNSIWFNDENNYNAALDILKQGSGVFDKFINDIYSANATNNPDGTIGSGLLYSFSNGITYQGQAISINSLPPYVLSKLGFQNSFLDASTAYSGISRTSIQGLTRNGVLFDNGGIQPEATLRELYQIYKDPASVNEIGIGDFGISAAIIAAIAAAVIGIIGAIAGAVASSQKAENEARTIDTALTDTARLSRLGPSLMPEQNDFMPSNFGGTNTGGGTGGGGGGTGGGSGSSSNGMIIAAIVAAVIIAKNKK